MSILLPFPSGCVVGRLIRREKRFFVHVLIDGKPDVAHTNNTGSMIGLLRPGAPVLLSPAQNPERKLRWTLELVWCGDPAAYPRGGFWAGVNTSTPNRMLEAAFRAGKLPWAEGYTSFAREKVRGESRLDGLLEGPGMPRLWVECKNVTMSEDDVALFPDAVATGPGRKANEHEVGLLIGLSSVAGDRGRASNYAYGSAKAGFSAFLSGLRARLWNSGVRVLTVKPGYVATGMIAGRLLPSCIVASPELVARDILRAVRTGRDVLYTPGWWRPLLALYRALPECVAKRLKL